MKLSIERSFFLKALSHGQSVVERRTTLPILSHILLTAMPSGLVLTTTDMDLALIETIPAQVEEVGTICVSAHILHEIVRKMTDKNLIEMVLDQDSGQVIITSGRSRFNLSCLSAEDFPQLTHGELSHHFSLPSTTLKYLIDNSRFAMSNEETRYHLNGIHFHTVESTSGMVLRAVATDMHRLASIECPMPEGADGMPDIIVGRKTIVEIRKLLDESDQIVNISLSSARIEFAIAGASSQAVLSSRLIDGTFPEYKEALDVDNDKTLIVGTKAFAEAVDRVGTVVNDKVRAIKLTLSENSAVLSAVNTDFGSATEELDVDYPYPDAVELCFNVRYLLDISQQIEEEEMRLLVSDGESSVLVKPLNNDNVVYILMPMRA